MIVVKDKKTAICFKRMCDWTKNSRKYGKFFCFYEFFGGCFGDLMLCELLGNMSNEDSLFPEILRFI